MKPYLLLRLAALTGVFLLFFTDPLPAREYTASPEAVELIKAHEACRLTAYPDAQGWSIGYGHHGEDVFPGMTITQDEAERLFRVDIEKRSASVRRLIEGLPYEVEFSQGFIDALFSLVYNCGERRVRESQFSGACASVTPAITMTTPTAISGPPKRSFLRKPLRRPMSAEGGLNTV